MKRRHLLLGAGMVVCLSYGFTYWRLRSVHHFVHLTEQSGTKKHEIAIGTVAEGPSVFVAIFTQLSKEGKLENKERFAEIAQEYRQKITSETSRRRAILHFFSPLASIETLYWQIVTP